MRWVKDQKVENNLRRLGIKFDVETGIPLSSIDREEGMRRQVRLCGRLMDDVVVRYGMNMEDSDAAFPMPILQWERKRKTYFPWSGNHRLAGFDLANISSDKKVDAYVVEIFDPVMQDLLPRVVNTWEAVVGMSKEEAIVNARFMIEKHGMLVADAAKLFGVRSYVIYETRRAEEVKEKIANLGVPSNGFSRTILDHMHTISENVNVLKRTAKILHDFRVKGKEAGHIIEDVRKASTEAQRITQLEKWESVLTERHKPRKEKGASVKLPHREVNRDRFLRLLQGLSRFLDGHRTATQVQVTDPAHLKIVKDCWKTIRPTMENILSQEVRA